MPHSPKPPTMMVAPSGMSRMASSAFATTLFIGYGFYFERASSCKREGAVVRLKFRRRSFALSGGGALNLRHALDDLAFIVRETVAEAIRIHDSLALLR